MNSQQTPWQPLYSVARSGVTELCVSGIIAVVADGAADFPPQSAQSVKSEAGNGIGSQSGSSRPGLLLERGDVDYPLWTRSLLKPIQLASHFQILKASYPKLKPEHFALMSSSHNCEDSHMRLLLEIMEIGGVNPSQLRCPPAMPFDACTREHYKQDGKEPASLYHNCSGKHFSYLMSLQAQGKAIDDYTNFDNIEHTRVEQLLAQLVNRQPNSFAKTTDGCQLPNHALSVREMAIVYQKLAQAAGDFIVEQPQQRITPDCGGGSSETANELGYIGSLMHRFPHTLGGNDRLDTRIMSGDVTGGGAIKFLAKDGADGLLALSVLPTREL